MNYYWEDATKYLQRELHNPLLRVEFNSLTQKYEVLKWIPRTAYIPVTGFYLDSGKEIVWLGYTDGRYQVEMTFDKWDGRVLIDMRRGRPDRRTAKEIIQDLIDDEYRIQKSLEKKEIDINRDTFMEMHKRLCPTFISYSKEGIPQ